MGESGPHDVDSTAVTAAVKSAGEARHPEMAKQSATTKPELAESSGEAGSHWSRSGGQTNTAAAAAVANSADEARPPGFAKHSAKTEFRVVEVSKISCQVNVDERLGYEVANAVGRRFISDAAVRDFLFFVVTDALAHVMFLFETEHHRVCLSAHEKQNFNNYGFSYCAFLFFYYGFRTRNL